MRKLQTSVTVFVHFGDYYLFLLRDSSKKVDPNRLNGVGGKVEAGEDLVSAVIRECAEEVGYTPKIGEISFSGTVRLEGGYKDDWMMGFFKVSVDHLIVANQTVTPDGVLLWLHKDEVLNAPYDLVDDLNYCFMDVVRGESLFFINAILNDDEKIVQISRHNLPRA